MKKIGYAIFFSFFSLSHGMESVSLNESAQGIPSSLSSDTSKELEAAAREARYREAAQKISSPDLFESLRAKDLARLIQLIEGYPIKRAALICQYGAFIMDDSGDSNYLLECAEFMAQRVLHKTMDEICLDTAQDYIGEQLGLAGKLEHGDNNNNVPTDSHEQEQSQPVITRRPNAVESEFMSANTRNLLWMAGGAAAAGTTAYALHRYFKRKDEQVQLALKKESEGSSDAQSVATSTASMVMPKINNAEQAQLRVKIPWGEGLHNTFVIFFCYDMGENPNSVLKAVRQALAGNDLFSEIQLELALEAVNYILTIAPRYQDKFVKEFYLTLIKQCESFKAQHEEQ